MTVFVGNYLSTKGKERKKERRKKIEVESERNKKVCKKTRSLGTQNISCIKRLKPDYKDIKLVKVFFCWFSKFGQRLKSNKTLEKCCFKIFLACENSKFNWSMMHFTACRSSVTSLTWKTSSHWTFHLRLANNNGSTLRVNKTYWVMRLIKKKVKFITRSGLEWMHQVCYLLDTFRCVFTSRRGNKGKKENE